jgi:hypothetical protein
MLHLLLIANRKYRPSYYNYCFNLCACRNLRTDSLFLSTGGIYDWTCRRFHQVPTSHPFLASRALCLESKLGY